MHAILLLAALAGVPALHQKSVQGGLTVELSVARVDGKSAPMQEGDEVFVDLVVTDSASGTPMTSLRPSVWMTRRVGNPEVDDRKCAAKIAAIASGSLFSAADVDLNIYYVLALNTDGTITVVNPRFSFGGSHLLAIVELSGRGEDWVLTADQSRLFVSIPAKNRVAVVDTSTWKVTREIATGANPTDVELQADGKYLWVATDAGVTAIDTATLAVAKAFDTGRGPHRLALTGDSGIVLVTNAAEGTLSLIDVASLTARAGIAAGGKPVAVAWSSRSELAYSASADGVILIVDPKRGTAIGRIATHAGIHDLRISRDGKWAFVLNREKNLVQVLDAAAGRLVHGGIIDGTPEQVTFTDTLAYITQVNSDQVLMSTLASLGQRGAPLGLADFPGGDNALGKIPRSGLAGGIASAAGENAVLVANAADGEIYYYKEGMAAPMGRFTNYGRQPVAVLSLDRSMRERAPGSFRTQTRLARGGVYDVEVLIDQPRAVSCFQLPVATNEAVERERRLGRIAIEYLENPRSLPAGRESAIRFRIRDVRTNEERQGVADVAALVARNPGGWRAHQPATARADGTYELTVHPPEPGVYYVYVESPSLQLRLSNPHVLIFDAH